MEYFLLFFYAVIAIGFSFFCSVAEAVLLSVSPSYIASQKEENPKAAKLLAHLKENIDRPLAAILSLNTIAHTVGAAGVGAQAAAIYGSRAVGIASAVMTLLILILSEIIPKTLGATYWRALAYPMGIMVRWLIIVLLPLVWLSELITRLLGGQGHGGIVTREEIAALAEIGEQQGMLEQSESQIFRNLLRFRDLTVGDIMTPRTVMIALREQQTIEEVFQQESPIPVSRIPVYRERLDDISGLVLRNDLLLAKANDETEKQVGDFKRELRQVDESQSLAELFDLLLNQRTHIALVHDRFGGVAGLVTLEDLIETLLGLEIVDEHDTSIDMQQLARNQWKKRAQKIGFLKDENEDGENILRKGSD